MEIENSELEQEIFKRERFGLCEVCDKNQSKYTCPKCEVRFCSLMCSKIHKKELECDGIRDKTKYIPLKKMTPMDFMNDYYFLEEATTFTKEIKTNRSVKNVKKINHKFFKLKKAAMARNVKLYFVNTSLSKRRKNLSSYNAKENVIVWNVEFNFLNADFKTSVKVEENAKIQEVIKNILDKNESVKQLDFFKCQESKLKVLLKAEGLRKKRYFHIDSNKTLKSILSGKVVIEYPTFFVTFDYSSDEFDIVCSDDETIEKEQKEFSKTLQEEVFNKKVGQNPMFILKPEEIPIIAEILNQEEDNQKQVGDLRQPFQPEMITHKINATTSHGYSDDDDDIRPENYFFTS